MVQKELRCAQCGQGNPSGARFCANCGTALPEAYSTGGRKGLHWGYRFWLAWLAGLVGGGVVGGIVDAVTGRSFGAGVYVLLGMGAMAWLGSLLWMGLGGRLPGVEQRLHPLWRLSAAIVSLGINGAIGVIFFLAVHGGGGFLWGNRPLILSFGIGLFFFLLATIGEIVAFLTVWGVVYLARKGYRSRQGRPASA
ncbi:MAG: zinc ribbon domain-containing protein [SAR202 cluster bacterium]|nr:zinc ribbon domain-containing protein [SAR202 cluster bacterium]